MHTERRQVLLHAKRSKVQGEVLRWIQLEKCLL